MLFDWLIAGQVVPTNPASAVRGPKHVVKTGKTPVLEGREWRRLIDTIPTDTARDLRDRALIATLSLRLCPHRGGAEDASGRPPSEEFASGRPPSEEFWLADPAARERRQAAHDAVPPCAREALHAYIAAAGIGEDRKGFLFRTSRGYGGTVLSDQPMAQADAWRMVRKRALAAGIMAPIGNHSFRATGITAYLANGGTLEHAQSMAAHESPRTTKLYDRTKERLTQDEIERIVM